MKLIFGFDLGPTSIGWAIVREKENDNEKSEIVKLGVRVSPLSTDEDNNFRGKKKSLTPNAQRRQLHNMRVNLSRYKQRRENLKWNLLHYGFITNQTLLCEDGKGTTFETLHLRAKAATEEVSLEEFARILLMINKKRGYKSARNNPKSDGVAIDGIDIAKILYRESITPGEYVYNNLKQKKTFIPQFYRSDLISELDKIWDIQSRYYPELQDDLKTAFLRGKSTAEICKALNAQDAEIKDKPRLYSLRARAVKEQLKVEELICILGKIKEEINNSSNLLSTLSDRSKMLYFNDITIGQYLWNKIQDNPNNRLKGTTTFYRQDYEDEFEKIWDTQAKFHKELTPELKKNIHNIIFLNRDPKKQKKSVCEFERQEKEIVVNGKTKTIEIGPKVCPKSSPIFQEFRLLQTINNVILSNDDEERSLTDDERRTLFKELCIKKSLSAPEILKTIKLSKKQWSINLDKIQGNTTLSSLFDAYKEIIEQSGHDNNDFSKANYADTIAVIKPIFKALGIKTEILGNECPVDAKSLKSNTVYQLWHLLKDNDSGACNKPLIDILCRRYGLSREYASILANVSFEREYGNLSAKAMMKILPFLRKGMKYSDACKAAGYNHSVRSLTREEISAKTLNSHIDLLPRHSLRQPVAEKILNQLINITNELIATYGNPDEIRVELARELKKNAEERAKLYSSISKNEKDNEAIRKVLKEKFHLQIPSRNDIIRYKLYRELEYTGYKTLYSQQHITEDNLFSKEIEIEHIIPQARFFDDSIANKTLEFHKINQDKSNNTAYDYIISTFGIDGALQYKNRVDDMLRNGKISRRKHKYLLMKASEIPDDFINRDICETQYISRKAMEILEPVTRRVVATTGSITARLREDWRLVDVMKELNWEKYNKLGLTETINDKDGRRIYKIKDWTKRNDHRHHAMDALAVAFTKQSFIQYLNTLNARGDKDSVTYAIQQKELHRNLDGRLCFNQPLPFNELRAEAERQLSSILVSHKAKNKVTTRNVNVTKGKGKVGKQPTQTPRGELHNATIYGMVKQYSTKMEKVDASFDEAKISTIANAAYRSALTKRLAEFDGNAKKAFTGKNSLDKNSLYINEQHSASVPNKVKTVTIEEVSTQRIAVDAKLDKKKIEKVLDAKIRRILGNRLEAYGNDPAKAFSNLEENPIWLDEANGISIKRLTIKAKNVGEPIHFKRNNKGELMLDNEGKPIPTDYAVSMNNHHSAIYQNAEGKIENYIVSFAEAVNRKIHNLPVVDKNYNSDEGWKFLFSIKKNEYFVFPNEETGFNPAKIDLLNPDNYAIISPNLFRVQSISKGDYTFRHHLETTAKGNTALQGITWKRIKSLPNLSGIVKVRVNNIGQIVAVGEY